MNMRGENTTPPAYIQEVIEVIKDDNPECTFQMRSDQNTIEDTETKQENWRSWFRHLH